MIPGEDLYYQCPICGDYTRKGSLISGNTIGAKYYSDGKVIAPMLPTFPMVSKCGSCGKLFWLKEQNKVELDKLPDGTKAMSGETLTVYDYAQALRENLMTNKSEEKHLQLQIMWGYNDRVRKGRRLIAVERDKLIWNENLMAMIELLDERDENDCIVMAEIHRYLGNFDRCKEIMSLLDQESFSSLIEIFGRECDAENREVVVLS
ncbi:MAG: hypothetical protein COW63_05155 [Bacteroidetes bacterium CG18_big_fil_WC_8_21_14_2_50_41_14]|nr:MAG: hypothetical protein COW63_05155 [Bacteroidetes bacterium CG18_big_fil_WC_8_21_14_2_50_41_14]